MKSLNHFVTSTFPFQTLDPSLYPDIFDLFFQMMTFLYFQVGKILEPCSSDPHAEDEQ